MSFLHVHNALEADLPVTGKLVLVTICENADTEGRYAYPSYREIARRSSTSRRTVIRWVAELERLGYLQVDRTRRDANGDSDTNLYTVFPEFQGGGESVAPGGAGRDTRGGVGRGTRNRQGEPSKEPSDAFGAQTRIREPERTRTREAADGASAASAPPPSPDPKASRSEPVDSRDRAANITQEREQARAGPESNLRLLRRWWEDAPEYEWLRILMAGLKEVQRAPPDRQWADEITEDFGHVDLAGEAKRFRDYWQGAKRKLKNWRLALRNWLGRAEPIQRDNRHYPFADRCVCPMCEAERSGYDPAGENWS